MYNNQLADQPLYHIADSDDMLYQANPIPNQDQVYSNGTPNTINTTIPPQNYIPIPNTPNQKINQPIQSPQYIQKSIGASSSLELSELFDDLTHAKKASVLKYFQRECCDFDGGYKIRVSIINNDGSSRYIFICKQVLPNFISFYIHEYEIKMKYIPRDSTDAILETKDFDKILFNLMSNYECEYKPRIQVRSTVDNSIIGRIQQPRTCSCCCKDPNFQIYPRYYQSNIPKYFITTNGKQCSYCCCVMCNCAWDKTNFQIRNGTTNLICGNVLKKDFKLGKKGEGDDFLTYDIDFPDDALPEEKILIICAVIGIDNDVYRGLGNEI